jgi:peptidoglycan hydrolase-like protein with peptidoglycan-binding domain
MPVVTGVITSGTVSSSSVTIDPTPTPVLLTVPVATIAQLHAELAAVGLPVAGSEATVAPQFGPETQARVAAFQQLYGLPVTSTVDPTTGALMTLAALVSTESDRGKLRAGLRSAQGRVADSPHYDYWLARCAILAGDYDLAVKVRPARDASKAGEAVVALASAAKVGPVLAASVSPTTNAVLAIPDAPPQTPEIGFPENFYSYRFDVIAQEVIEELRTKAPELKFSPAPQPDFGAGGLEPTPTDDSQGIVIHQLRKIDDPGTDEPPGVPEIPPPPTPPTQSPKAFADSARAFLDALEAWQAGNAEFVKERYASAVRQYNACQQSVLAYFALVPDYQLKLTASTLAGRMDELVFRLASDLAFWSSLWSQINFRRQLLTLVELGQYDWTRWAPIEPETDVYRFLEGNLAGKPNVLPPAAPLPATFRQVFMDAHLLVIAAVLVPLARAEANRLRRQYAAALDDLTRFSRRDIPVPGSSPASTIPAVLPCEFIEYPFARLLAAETLLDQAETQYKSRLSVDDEIDAVKKAAAVARLKGLGDEFTNRHIPSGPDTAHPFQNLVAALTYASVLDSQQTDGAYVARTKQALDGLQTAITAAVDAGDVSSLAFQSVAQAMTVPTIVPVGAALPGLTNGTHPHEPYLQFAAPAGQSAMREKNPRVYSVLLTAQARLLQIWSGFNYLGYRDDYLPPWRFHYLLDRSRYFAEHARNAQRDYLNFLSNAENEELKELSAAQNVELEKANVQIETARVEQAGREVEAAKKSALLAKLQASDAQTRLANFKDFESNASIFDQIASFGAVVGAIATVADPLAGVGVFGKAVIGELGVFAADSKRDLERQNLELAVGEANQAKAVADAHVAVAKASQTVVGLQRQASLLRHEFALQSLRFMRNRALNTEQWYRLAGAIRSVGDTYLRYAIETAFLAQQAYNFEGDRRIDVIRFDYDLSDVGQELAGDFLLRDLDTLEQDLIVNEKTRLQHMRYVLSLAREFPDLMRAIGETGEGTFSMPLERLERHFAGLCNLRIDSVDVQPVALMDTTRTSIELTHLGTGMIRLRAQPGASPLNTTDLLPGGDWLGSAGSEWPIKVHVSGPDTSLFTGISRLEASSLGTITPNERGAFEGLPAASSWQLRMSLNENNVVPGTLADVLITFNISGYHDPELRSAIDATKSQVRASTMVLSAQRTFPDGFFDFSRTGRMVWKVRQQILSRDGDLGRLRNIGMSLRPGATNVQYSRLMTRMRVNFRLNDTAGTSGAVTVFTGIPETSVSQTSPMTVAVRAAMNGATELAWDFGDGTPILRSVRTGTTTPPAEGTHTYARPGRYVIKLRCVQNDALSEFRVSVAVSRKLKLGDPLIITPSRFTVDGSTRAVTIGAGGAVQQAGRMFWRVGDLTAEGNTATFKLKPGNYTLDFVAVRKLSFRAYGAQRFFGGAVPLPLRGFSAMTNRTFDGNGNEKNGTGTPPLPARNELAKRLFDKGTISPEDDWTFELIPEEILGVPAGTLVAGEELDLADIQDVALTMEYDVAPVAVGAVIPLARARHRSGSSSSIS